MIKYADPTMPLEERCERLNAALNHALDRNEALEAELALAKEQLKVMFEGNVGYRVLQQIALDPTADKNLQCRAAAALAPFERPKLSASMVSTASRPLAEILDAHRQAGKVIEQAKPLPDSAALGPDSAA